MRNAALKYDVSSPQGPLGAPALRRWLHGHWALLFSHPDDFAAYGFESDRWLVHVQEAKKRCVRPPSIRLRAS